MTYFKSTRNEESDEGFYLDDVLKENFVDGDTKTDVSKVVAETRNAHQTE